MEIFKKQTGQCLLTPIHVLLLLLLLCSYLAYRLLGTALPLLSLEQLEEVLSGDVMRHYGEHVTSAQVRPLLSFTFYRLNLNLGHFVNAFKRLATNLKGHLDPRLGGAGDLTSSLQVTSQPALPPELLSTL